jgi:hypothetical protein
MVLRLKQGPAHQRLTNLESVSECEGRLRIVSALGTLQMEAYQAL